MYSYKLLCAFFLFASVLSSPVSQDKKDEAPFKIPEEVKSIIERFKSKIEVYKSLHSTEPSVTPKVSLKDFIQNKIKARTVSKRSVDFQIGIDPSQRYWSHARSSLGGGGQSPFDSYFASMAKEFKSKVMEKVVEKKDFIASTVQNKLKMLSDTFNFTIDANEDSAVEGEENVRAESVESAEVAPAVVESPEAASPAIEESINEAITAKVQGSTDAANTEMDQAILQGLVVKALQNYRPKVKQLNETRKSFFKALDEMKAAATVLDQPPPASEKTVGSEISLANQHLQDVMSFKTKLREMILKKTEYTTQKEQLRSEMYGTMQNLFAVSRNLTGQPFSFLEALASVLNEEANKKLIAAEASAAVPGSVEPSSENINGAGGNSQVIESVPLSSSDSVSISDNTGNVISQDNGAEVASNTVNADANQAVGNTNPEVPSNVEGSNDEMQSATGPQGAVVNSDQSNVQQAISQASADVPAGSSEGAQSETEQANPTGNNDESVNVESPSIPAMPVNEGTAVDSNPINAAEITGSSQAISPQAEAGQAISEGAGSLDVESQPLNSPSSASEVEGGSQSVNVAQSDSSEANANTPNNPSGSSTGTENNNSEAVAAELIQSLDAQGQAEQAVVPANDAESESNHAASGQPALDSGNTENAQTENAQTETSGNANIQIPTEPLAASSESQNGASDVIAPVPGNVIEESQNEPQQAVNGESNSVSTNSQPVVDGTAEVTENLREAAPVEEAGADVNDGIANPPVTDAIISQSETDQVIPNESEAENSASQPQNSLTSEDAENNPSEAAPAEEKATASSIQSLLPSSSQESPIGAVEAQAEIIAQMAQTELDQVIEPVAESEDTNQETEVVTESQPQTATEAVADSQSQAVIETEPEAAPLSISNDTIISSIDEAITAEVQGNSDSIQTAMNEAIIRGLALEVLKDFEPQIQSLNETRQEFFGSLAELSASAAELGNVSASTNLTEGAGMSNETFEALMAYKEKLGDLILKKNEYNAAKTLLKNDITTALQNLSATAENLTGDPLSFVDALAALRSSNTSLFTILNEDAVGQLSGANGLGLALGGKSNGEAFGNPTVIGVAVAGCLAIVAAVALVGVVVLKKRRRHNIYTHLPGESLVYSSNQNYGSNSTTVLQ